MKNIFQEGLFSPATGEQVFTWMDVTAVFTSVPLKWTNQGFIHIYHPDMWFCCLNKQDHYTAISVTWRTWSKRRQPQILAYRLEKRIGHLRSLLVPADKPALHRHSLKGLQKGMLQKKTCLLQMGMEGETTAPGWGEGERRCLNASLCPGQQADSGTCCKPYS